MENCYKTIVRLLICALIIGAFSSNLSAQTGPTDDPAIIPPSRGTPPYEDRLHRVAEIVGSLYYLTELCQTESDNQFRQKMLQIIEAETNDEPERRKQLIAQYNKGYRAFSSVYTKCTDAAQLIAADYRTEGQKLIEELLTRYAN